MHSLRLVCSPDEAETVSAELWEAGTAGIRELEGTGNIILIAGFETQQDIPSLAVYQPEWSIEDDTDWIAQTKSSWPARAVGDRLFLAPVWNEEPTPEGHVRIIHNPGQASGTGEHPCTQLALEALEKSVMPGILVADIGTGSGLLAIATLKLGASVAIAIDTDEAALQTARENFGLNNLPAPLAAGSAECLRSESADLVVANISASVLLSMADDLLQIMKPTARLVLTGFPESELRAMQQMFGAGEVTALNEWRCLSLPASQ